MSHRRLRPIARGLALVPVLVSAAIAGCADSPVAPATGPTARPTAIAANAFGLDAAAPFLEGFTHTGNIELPVAPIAWDATEASTGWSIVRHQRDPESWYRIEEMDAWHGGMCQKPDHETQPTHKVSEYHDLVFLCRNHIMTATNSTGYGITYLTPGRMADFSDGTAVVRFDVATLRESGRDWIDLWLTPYDDNLVTPLDDSLPDLQGEPRNAVHVRMTADIMRSAFVASVVRNHRSQALPVATGSGYEDAFRARNLAPSATRRDAFELHISRTHLKFGMPQYNLWWVDTELPQRLNWSQAVVQIGHHSFNPRLGGGNGKATTWHWDNIGVSPAVPFSIQRATRRYVDDNTPGGEVEFPGGAPEYSHLRFSAIGETEVSFVQDGGDEDDDKWKRARRQAEEGDDRHRFSSYWMPIPQGTTRVRFRPIRRQLHLSDGRWMVRDISTWSTDTKHVKHPTPPGHDDENEGVESNGHGQRGG